MFMWLQLQEFDLVYSAHVGQGDSTMEMKHEEMDRGQSMSNQDPTFPPSMVHVPFQV